MKNDNWTFRKYRQRLLEWDVYEFGAHLGHTWGKVDHQAVYRLAQSLLDSGMAVLTNIFLQLSTNVLFIHGVLLLACLVLKHRSECKLVGVQFVNLFSQGYDFVLTNLFSLVHIIFLGNGFF